MNNRLVLNPHRVVHFLIILTMKNEHRWLICHDTHSPDKSLMKEPWKNLNQNIWPWVKPDICDERLKTNSLGFLWGAWYCWRFRNPGSTKTSWGWSLKSHYLQSFSTIPGGDLRISEPSTVSNRITQLVSINMFQKSTQASISLSIP